MTLTSDFNPNVAVPFSRMRYMMSESGGGHHAGVVGATDLKVVQRGAGANMSVDVGTGGGWVAITTGTRNGLVHCFNDAAANVAVTASNATNPRIDQIYLRYNDSSIPTGSGDVPTLAVATGTATAGATLDNRTGAIALPADTLRLADILVPATSTSVITANIRDRRSWARGAHVSLKRTSADITTTSGTLIEVDATNLKPRIECSGVPLKMWLVGRFGSPAAGLQVAPALDGASVASGFGYSGVNLEVFETFVYEFDAPAAGSHLFSWLFGSITAGQTTTIRSSATAPLQMIVEEIIRPNTSNS